MWIIKKLLPLRRHSKLGPFLALIAGGGVNSAPVGFSACVSKIALMKLAEYLDIEFSDLRSIIFARLIKTKIHDEVLHHGSNATSAYLETNADLKKMTLLQWTAYWNFELRSIRIRRS